MPASAAHDPVRIGALGRSPPATLVVLFVLCTLAAVAFPTARLAHRWVEFSAAPIGSAWNFAEGIFWSGVMAWVSAGVFGLVYSPVARQI